MLDTTRILDLLFDGHEIDILLLRAAQPFAQLSPIEQWICLAGLRWLSERRHTVRAERPEWPHIICGAKAYAVEYRVYGTLPFFMNDVQMERRRT